METLLLLVVVGLMLLYFLKRRSTDDSGHLNKQQTAQKPQATADKAPFRSTVIITGDEACEAVRALAEKPFLDSDKSTPNLPLANCTATRCRCRYAHRDDRRELDHGPRRMESGQQSEAYRISGNMERRYGDSGRRHDD